MRRGARENPGTHHAPRDDFHHAERGEHNIARLASWLRRRSVALAVSGLLLAAIAAVFGQTLGHKFVEYDDPTYVYDNPLIRAGITGEGLRAAFTKPHALNWHPLTTISHMLDCQFCGLNPRWHHATNVVLHAATALVLLLVLTRMTGRFWRAAIVVAIFAVHPLRVESVAWVAERKDVLSGLFFALTLGAYVRYCRRPFSILNYLVVVACFALGLMSKPMLVTLPFVLLLLDYWPLGRTERKTPGDGEIKAASPYVRLLLEKVPLFVLSAGSCVATLLAQGHEMEAVQSFPLVARITNAAISCVAYLGQMFWPARLAVLYPHPVVTGALAADRFWIWRSIGAATLLAAVTAVAVLTRRRFPWLLVGWLWYLGMLVPVIGLAQAGWQSMADRYTYLPHIGISLALVWTAAELSAGWPFRRLVGGLAAAVLIAAMIAIAWRQTTFWQNSETLWSRALDCTSRNAVAHTGLGKVYQSQGRIAEAVKQYQLAIEINPVHLQAHNNLGAILFQQGRLDEAIKHYQAAVRANPNYAKAHGNLGSCYYRQGKVNEAIAEYRLALKIDPNYVDARNNLALVLKAQGSAEKASAP